MELGRPAYFGGMFYATEDENSWRPVLEARSVCEEDECDKSTLNEHDIRNTVSSISRVPRPRL
jgi:hypothetical protein